jgi:hypothetical protein
LAIGPVDYQKNRRQRIGVYGFLSRNPREIASKIASCQEVRTAFRALNRVRSIAIIRNANVRALRGGQATAWCALRAKLPSLLIDNGECIEPTAEA